MTQRTLPHTHRAKETFQRSVSKTISYCLAIMILDLVFSQLKFAFVFLLMSNFYIAVAYYFHERFWDGITWGKFIYKKGNRNSTAIIYQNRLPNHEETI